jgi:hypothetical protein
VTILDRKGTTTGTSGPPILVQTLQLAPDETRLLATFGGNAWLLEPNRPGMLRLERRSSTNTLWYAHGSRFLDVLAETGGVRLVTRPVTGSGSVDELPVPTGLERLQDISPDGKILLFNRGAFDTDVFSARLDGAQEEPRALVRTGETIINTTFSPDGHWIVYQAIGQAEGGIHIQPFPGPGLRRQIANSGEYPVWRKDGRELVYLDDHQGKTYVWSVPITGKGSELRAGVPVPLFPVRLPAATFGDLNFLAVSSDGSRFYIPEAVDQPGSDVIQIRLGGIK